MTQCQLLIIGDFMSNKDAEDGGPWRDGIGRMMKGFLRQQGIEPRECQFINVFNYVPKPRAVMDTFLGTKKESVPHLKMFKRGKYLKKEYYADLQKLWDTINHHNPNLILACGDLATWATCAGHNPIDTSRGRIAVGNSAIGRRKILPTYSPKQVVANWTMRPVILADLEKAEREMQFPEIVRPQRFIHIEPTLEEMEDFLNRYILPCTHLASDIETKGGSMITCVSFAPSLDRALVVPFYTEAHKDGNYWRTAREEYLAWQFVKRVLKLGKKVNGQNYQYDMQYEWRELSIPNPDFADDTMLMHHVLQPEMRKGLGFLASVYTNEIQWKGMHKISASDRSVKKGDGE